MCWKKPGATMPAAIASRPLEMALDEQLSALATMSPAQLRADFDAVAGEIVARGGAALAIAADVTDPDAVAAALTAAAR